MLLLSLLLTLSLMLTNSDYVLGQKDECGGPLSCTPFNDIEVGAAYYSRCTYPTHKLNESCILSTCPLLSGLCPISSEGCVNNTALTRAMTILNTCIGQNSLICGTNMSHIPTVQISWTTENLIPVNIAYGSVNLIPGTGFLDNLSSATFTLMQTDNTNGSISLNIQAPNIVKRGNYSCSFDVGSKSVLRSLGGLIPTALTFDIPNMIGHYYLNLSTIVSIDLTTSPPTVKTLDDQSNLTVAYSNFVTSSNSTLPQELVTLFNQGMECFLKNSIITSSAINFYSTYIALALQVAQKNCP